MKGIVVLLIGLVVGQIAAAQPAPQTWGLCIGIAEYNSDTLTLKWADKDAIDFCTSFLDIKLNLPKSQYRIIKDRDATQRNILDHLGWLNMSANPGDRVYIFYSGHGKESSPILPHDAENTLSLDTIKRALTKIEAQDIIFFADACYSGRLARSESKFEVMRRELTGLTTDVVTEMAHAKAGVVFMTSANGIQESRELEGQMNGIFTGQLIATLMKQYREADSDQDGKLTLYEAYQDIYRVVTAESEQQPQLSDENLAKQIVLFSYADSAMPLITPTPTPTAIPLVTPTVEPQIAETPSPKNKWVDPITGMEFARIPDGCYIIGCGDRESDCSDTEQPSHKVCLNGFWIGKYEVTQAQWQAVMGENPAYFTSERVGADTGNYPAESVSWDDVQEFLRRLNAQAGNEMYRLPSEAEWEYAMRADTDTAYSFGDDMEQLNDYAWYEENSRETTHPIGQLSPNGWGVYDMLGNVSEWVADAWHENYENAPDDGSVWESDGEISFRVLRGGAWNLNALACRSASRNRSNSSSGTNDLGFRLVLNADAVK